MTLSDKLLVTGAILVIPALVSAIGFTIRYESRTTKAVASMIIVSCLGFLIASAWVS